MEILVINGSPKGKNSVTLHTCKPVHLKRNCWIGAGSSILPGVTVGENSVGGAACRIDGKGC